MADVLGSRVHNPLERRVRSRAAAQPRGRAGHARRDVPLARRGRGRAHHAAARGLLPAGARAHLLGDVGPALALDPGRPPLRRGPARVHRRARGRGRQAVPARRHRRRPHHRELAALRRDREAHVDAAPAHRRRHGHRRAGLRRAGRSRRGRRRRRAHGLRGHQQARPEQLPGHQRAAHRLVQAARGARRAQGAHHRRAHRLQEARQAARRPAPRRPVHPRRAPVGGQDGARAQHRRQRGEGGRRRRGLLPRDVGRAARPARAVLRGAHQPAGRAHRLREGRRLVRDPQRHGQARQPRLLGRRHARRSRSSRCAPRRAASCATRTRA